MHFVLITFNQEIIQYLSKNLSSDLLWKYWIEFVVMELPCAKFTFPIRILCRGVSDYVPGCLYGMWCLINSLSLVCLPTFAKAILNELVSKF